jgi:hypothetical protein
MIPMATAKKRAKAHALMNRVADEPMIDQDNYNVSLTTALVWYRDNVDDKKRRKFAIEYFAQLGKKKEVLAINKADDYDVRQLGSLCRLVSNGNTLSEDHMKAIDNMANHIVAKEALPKKIKEDKTVIVPVVTAPSIQDRMDEKAHDLAGEIDAAIDEFVTTKSTTFSARNYLLANNVAAPIAKRIGEFYVPQAKEIREAIEGDDTQLVEGYSNFTKRELKKFAEFLENIVADCHQAVQTAKATRAPRKRKAATPTKQVSKMKYMKEFAELKLKSCKAEDIIGATELWVYNTKYRKVQVYKAEQSLAVKGTTILGFDVKESKSMTLRKPEEFFKGLSIGKRALNGALKKLTTKPTTPNGRINEECILLGAF